jgi:hypothetical protein
LAANAATLGAGAFIRYTGGASRIEVISKSVDADPGGVQVGVGARVRF